MYYQFLPRYKKGIRPGLYLIEPVTEEIVISDTPVEDVQVSHDGRGNVTVIAPGWTVTEDENGNLQIVGNKISITDDETGGIEMKTITINGLKFEVVDQTARDGVEELSKRDCLPAPETAAAGEYIQVSEVDADGKVTATEAVTIEATASIPSAEGVSF